jgi:NADH dehydrogenase/NADH:ubiquinone oxidoreductase subunit G
MISVAAAALIAGTGFANAQGTGMGREAPSAGSTVQQSAPPTGNSAAPTNRDAKETTAPSSGMKATQSEQKSPMAGKNQHAEDNMKAGPKGEKSAQDNNMKGENSKSMSSENDNAKGGSKEMKAEGRDDRSGNMNAQGREDRNGMKAEGREDRKGSMNAETKGADSKSQTTVGQAGANAKLSTEQRTRITTVIRSQHVTPVEHVNFSISVGTRVPHDVRFNPLPTEVVTLYPEWRGYEFILVGDQIVVIDPRTFEIVAVLEA